MRVQKGAMSSDDVAYADAIIAMFYVFSRYHFAVVDAFSSITFSLRFFFFDFRY